MTEAPATRPSLQTRPRPPIGRWLLVAFWILAILASARQTYRSNPEALKSGEFVSNFLETIREMIPPDPKVIPSLGKPLLDTLAMSVMSTTFALALAFPLAFLAARTTSPHVLIAYIVKGAFNALRAIPELITAIIFVASVGFGLLSGVLALGFHSAGMLGKFIAEAIEKVDHGLNEAVASCGGSRFHVIVFSVIPQILANVVDYTLYRWEHNFRASSVVGMVGAGGIGLELMSSLRLTQYRDVSAILLVVFAVVQVVDALGNFIRSRLVHTSRV